MKHIRLFVNLFGFKYCIKGQDFPITDVGPIVAAFAVATTHFPMLTIEVSDHA